MFLGPHKMKISHYCFSLWYPLELGNFELFPTETWDFFDFLTTPTDYMALYILKLEKYTIKCYILSYTIKVHQKNIYTMKVTKLMIYSIVLFTEEKFISQNKLL